MEAGDTSVRISLPRDDSESRSPILDEPLLARNRSESPGLDCTAFNRRQIWSDITEASRRVISPEFLPDPSGRVTPLKMRPPVSKQTTLDRHEEFMENVPVVTKSAVAVLRDFSAEQKLAG